MIALSWLLLAVLASPGRQAGKVGDGDAFGANLPCEMIDLFMRQLKKLVEQAEFVYQLKCRRMYGVAPKVADEVRMLFQQSHG